MSGELRRTVRCALWCVGAVACGAVGVELAERLPGDWSLLCLPCLLLSAACVLQNLREERRFQDRT